MKFVFIDEENLGCKALQDLSYKPTDKVLVFSRNEKVKVVCSHKMYACLHHYEDGSNQADFLIIATPKWPIVQFE